MRSSHLLLAVAGSALVGANPLFLGLFERSTCDSDNCARAVTGTDAQPSSTSRKSDCTSFMSHWPTGAVPTYASSCSGTARYSSACSCWGVTATSKSSSSLSTSPKSSTSLKNSSTTSKTSSTTSKTSSTTSKASSTTSKASSTTSKASSTASKISSTSPTITSVTSTTSKSSSKSSTASTTKTSTSSHSSTSTKSSSTTTTSSCPKPSCLTDDEATSIVGSFKYLLASPTAANFISNANDLLCDKFNDTSDSIDSLAGIKLGDVTFANKTAFIAGSGSQPPLIVDTYDIFHSCHKIAWRWVTVKGAGNDADEVKGIDTFYTDGCGHICQIFAEFNSAAWLYNLGDPECSPTSMITFASTLTSSTTSATATATTTSA